MQCFFEVGGDWIGVSFWTNSSSISTVSGSLNTFGVGVATSLEVVAPSTDCAVFPKILFFWMVYLKKLVLFEEVAEDDLALSSSLHLPGIQPFCPLILK